MKAESVSDGIEVDELTEETVTNVSSCGCCQFTKK
jgi:hypothetical protein